MKALLVLALVALVGGGSAVAAHAATKDRLASDACTARGKGVVIGGKAAQVYCGPAKATVHIGGKTIACSENRFTRLCAETIKCCHKRLPYCIAEKVAAIKPKVTKRCHEVSAES